MPGSVAELWGRTELQFLEIAIPIDDPLRCGALYGATDRNLRLIRAAFGVRISARNSTIHISGPDDDVRRAVQVIASLQRLLRTNPDITDEMVEDSIREATEEGDANGKMTIDVLLPSAEIVPRGPGQRDYVRTIRENDLTFCVGPAGTGKTYLAVAVAVSLLKHRKIKRLVLVRPAVEAGEKLGYLPGDLQAKVNPYLRPLFDAMHDMMAFDQIKRYMQNDVIEVVPLAFMRGRTLNNAVIILDEAQNATTSQMLMFLTRLGHHSKMIVTGDDSQSDLPGGEASGFDEAVARLEGMSGVGVVRLTSREIVRHVLVRRVVEAYADDEREA